LLVKLDYVKLVDLLVKLDYVNLKLNCCKN